MNKIATLKTNIDFKYDVTLIRKANTCSRGWHEFNFNFFNNKCNVSRGTNYFIWVLTLCSSRSLINRL